jgi:type II secretory pathway component PulF
MARPVAPIPTRDLVPLCRQLATSYDAGIPILRSLALVRQGARSRRAQSVLSSMEHAIQNGASLGEAAAAQRGALPAFLVNLLSAGEHGGRLDVMLRDLAEYYEDAQRMQRHIVGALIYPAIQLAAAWFLGSFSLGLVGRLGAPDFNLRDYFLAYAAFQGLAVGIFAGVWLCSWALARAGLWHGLWRWTSNTIWPLKGVTRKFALARFFRSLALLVSSGLDIRKCIAAAAASTANPRVEQDLLQSLGPIGQGASLVEAFAGTRTLTPVAREMLAIGEASGRLDHQLHKCAQYHLEEATAAVHAATRVMRVLITLGIGAIIGYIIISFYAQLYNFDAYLS